MDELDSAAGGCNSTEALISIFVLVGLGCLLAYGVSADADFKHTDGHLLCNDL